MYHYDLAIIGGGPAGLAAAATAIKAQLNFILISPDIGGKANYGFALRDRPAADAVWGAEFAHQLEEGVKAHPERHIKQKVSAVACEANGSFCLTLVGPQNIEQTIRANALIVTTGAEPRRLHIKGEKEYWGRGISYSTISHAAQMQGRDIVVIGSGERAITATLRLAPIANHVSLIPTMALQAADSRVEQMMNDPKISLLIGWEPERFSGDEFLKQLFIIRDNAERKLEVDAAFIELGLIPDKEFLRGVIEFDEETGQIPINQRCETAIRGLYAAGDVTNTYGEQIPVAIGEGIKATLSAWTYLVSTSQNREAVSSTA